MIQECRAENTEHDRDRFSVVSGQRQSKKLGLVTDFRERNRAQLSSIVSSMILGSGD